MFSKYFCKKFRFWSSQYTKDPDSQKIQGRIIIAFRKTVNAKSLKNVAKEYKNIIHK